MFSFHAPVLAVSFLGVSEWTPSPGRQGLPCCSTPGWAVSSWPWASSVQQDALAGRNRNLHRACVPVKGWKPLPGWWWPWTEMLLREVVESPSLEIFKTRLDAVLCSLLWVTLLGQGVGLGDPQRSLPTSTMLGSCGFVTVARQSGALSCASPWPLCPTSSRWDTPPHARPQGESPAFSPWLCWSTLPSWRTAGSPGPLALAQCAAGGGGPKGRWVPSGHPQPGSPLLWQRGGGCLCSQLPLLPGFCPHLPLPGEGGRARGGFLWWEAGGRQHEPYPRWALPTFWWLWAHRSGLGAWPAGQMFWLSP